MVLTMVPRREARVGAPLAIAIALMAAAPDPRVGVIEFAANGASEQLASAIAGVTAHELQRLGTFQVSTADAMRQLISLERQRQLLGCTQEECMSQALAQLVQMDYVVAGKVSRIAGSAGMPTTFTLELTLLNARQGKREASDIQTALSETELVAKVPRAVAKLVTKLLSGRAGTLVVSASEHGATVKLDDVVVGTTPLSGRLSVPAGPHFLIVEKEGFVTHQKEVRIEPARLVEEEVKLVPSPDFADAYEARASKMRLGAWLTTGLAVVAAGSAAVMQVRSLELYGRPDKPGTFEYHRAQILAGVEVDGEVDHRREVSRLKSDIQTAQTISMVGAGVAGAAAAAAVYLWIVGEPPGRYQQYREVAPAVSVAPTGAGWFAQLSATF